MFTVQEKMKTKEIKFSEIKYGDSFACGSVSVGLYVKVNPNATSDRYPNLAMSLTNAALYSFSPNDLVKPIEKTTIVLE